MISAATSTGPSADFVIHRINGVLKLPAFPAFQHTVMAAGLDVTVEETPAANVPEPDTLALVGTIVAVIALIALLRKRRR